MATCTSRPISTSMCLYSRQQCEMDSAVAAPAISQRRYTLHDAFYNVLAEVGAKQGQPYEWKDVIMLFIRYLAKRKPSLLDPENKSRVICNGDPLGTVFGVSCFTKDQTKLLVRQHVTLVEDARLYANLPPLPPITGPCPPPPLTALAAEQPAKRGPADEAPDDPDNKRSRPEAAAAGGPGPSGVPVAPAAPAPARRTETIETGGGVDGPLDAQTEEADSCDDTDDHRRTYAREMEPVECTEASDSDSSSGASDVDSPLPLTVLTLWADDLGVVADLETSESDTENRDTWMCTAESCRHANTARKSRCDRCWMTRPSWVVGPRRKKRRRRYQCRESSLLSHGSAGSQGDSTAGSQDASASSQETMTSSSSPPPPAADTMCLICCEHQRNAAIIHGRTGCQVTCYSCARRLWKQRDLCPSCRRTIEKIVFMRFG